MNIGGRQSLVIRGSVPDSRKGKSLDANGEARG
jgi:hypothetical protein